MKCWEKERFARGRTIRQDESKNIPCVRWPEPSTNTRRKTQRRAEGYRDARLQTHHWHSSTSRNTLLLMLHVQNAPALENPGAPK